MLRLIRLPFLLFVAFGSGFIYSEMTWSQRCADKGGEARGGVCFDATE